MKITSITEIYPISTENDYQAALREVSAFFDPEPEPGSPEGDHFKALLAFVEAYEAQHFPIDPPGPVAAIQFRMDQLNLTSNTRY